MRAVKALMALGCVSVVSVIAMTGCSAEPTTDDDVNVSSQDETVGELARMSACNATQNAAHVTATNLLRYVFGDDSAAPPASCSGLKSALDTLRTVIADPRVTVTHGTAPNVVGCGSNPPMYTIQTSDPRSFPLNGGPIAQGINDCYGNSAGMVQLYFMPYNTPSFISLDPEPATLTANLSSTSGATAAAYYTNSLITTNVKYRSGAAAACGTLVGGEPCSTTALASGSTAAQMIIKNSSICYCR